MELARDTADEIYDIMSREFHLLKSIARSEGLHAQFGKTAGYLPLFKHPLAISESRYFHEDVLRRVLSCKLEYQGAAAITKGDAWVLEEVYMRGGHSTLKEKNGNSLVHLAVQMGSIDCLMVLINIGVGLNEPNSLGFTPLYVAHSNRAAEVASLLAENGATMFVEKQTGGVPDSTALDVEPEVFSRGGVPTSALHQFLTLPESETYY